MASPENKTNRTVAEWTKLITDTKDESAGYIRLFREWCIKTHLLEISPSPGQMGGSEDHDGQEETNEQKQSTANQSNMSNKTIASTRVELLDLTVRKDTFLTSIDSLLSGLRTCANILATKDISKLSDPWKTVESAMSELSDLRLKMEWDVFMFGKSGWFGDVDENTIDTDFTEKETRFEDKRFVIRSHLPNLRRSVHIPTLRGFPICPFSGAIEVPTCSLLLRNYVTSHTASRHILTFPPSIYASAIRSLHSSSNKKAQPLPHGSTFDLGQPPYPPPPPPLPTPPRRGSLSSAQKAPQNISKGYIPQDSDFYWAPDQDVIEEVYEPSDLLESNPLPDAPPVPEYEEPEKTKRRKNNRRTRLLNLPPLPIGQMPPDGRTRFDWRQRSLSRLPHAKGERWFPDHHTRRTQAPFPEIEPGAPFSDEVKRYMKHFAPLLLAEYQEQEKIILQRLEKWSMHRLREEGVMLERLGATYFAPRKKVDGVVYQFSKTGREAAGAKGKLEAWKFTPGTIIFISRTDPFVDAVIAKDQIPTDGHRAWLRGRVYSQTAGNVRVVFPQPIEEFEKGHWRLDIGMSDWALVRQMEAMDSLVLDPFSQDMAGFPLPPTTTDLHPDGTTHSFQNKFEDDIAAAHSESIRHRDKDEFILRGSATRDLILRAFQQDYTPYESSSSSINATHNPVPDTKEMKPDDIDATSVPSIHTDQTSDTLLSRNALIKSWTTRYRVDHGKEPLKIEGDPEIPLNPSQIRAIAMMLSERLSLVQGPPGTGKTRVIVETIKLLKSHWQVPFPILVCAHTNVAVDNLLDGLQNHGLKAIRVGTEERIREDLQKFALSEMEKEHPLYDQVVELERKKKELFASKPDQIADPMAAQKRGQQLQEIFGKLHGWELQMRQDVLADADVICATCLSAASFRLHQIDFPMVFLDEASMATEPLSLVPLMKGSSNVAIIGDHKQLPPVIVSPQALAGGLGTSLFERLIHERNVPSIMLDTQYRMHPSISSFPNQAFYNSALKDGTVLSDGRVREDLKPPKTSYLVSDGKGGRKNVTFVDHRHPESPENQSLANYGDAVKVVDIVADLLDCNPDLKGSEIGIISPYTAQIRILTQYLQYDESRLSALSDLLGEERAKQVQEIEIKTVDGFEGREKQIMIFSTVRNNHSGHIGFLADWRRLNVGITRAKRCLIIVGSEKTLGMAKETSWANESLPQGGAKAWRDFIKCLKEGEMILSVE
ncbi:hypothetical protein M231_04419 [Tremella mesenterica]|uniref:AAA+ ATPase domain-containing protein n=1 Tax=Tremella mesenterica TaxID=5217 RepID=A0A4V1M3W1_TREME|nr:hypothetical protein M231_04419 [Tremella mesenterica]